MRTLFNKLIQVAQTFSSDFSDKMTQWSLDVLMDSYFDVAYPMKCGLMTLVHADLWTNNILFKQDSDGNSNDVKIIDYQMSFWGSPNADLIYLLFTSVMDDVKVKHFDEIIEFYYVELRRSLELVKYGEYIPTVEELKADLMDNRMYGKEFRV
jgi:thiamine kinase-like enzyme